MNVRVVELGIYNKWRSSIGTLYDTFMGGLTMWPSLTCHPHPTRPYARTYWAPTCWYTWYILVLASLCGPTCAESHEVGHLSLLDTVSCYRRSHCGRWRLTLEDVFNVIPLTATASISGEVNCAWGIADKMKSQLKRAASAILVAAGERLSSVITWQWRSHFGCPDTPKI